MNPSLKRALHWAGRIISLAGIVYVGLRLNAYGAQLDFSPFDLFTWIFLSGSALVYGGANVLLALAWWNLLAHFGATVDRIQAVKIYGLTQPAKYVPGNIMHLAGRQAMGMSGGIAGWSLAKSSVWELGLILMAGVFFSLLVLPQILPMVTAPIAFSAFAAAALLMTAGLRRKISPAVARAFGFYVAFLMVSGMVFAGLLAVLPGLIPLSPFPYLTFCGAFIVAWVAGLVTPGAPAGLGVRELVLVTLLGGLVQEGDLLVAVLLSRAVTVVGDLLFFLVCQGLVKSRV